MENLNEVLPKYKVTRNGIHVTGSTNRINIMDDYSTTVADSNLRDVVEVWEEDRCIASTVVKENDQ